MSAVSLAMFDQYEIAERVRVDLVRDGFPTDRIELTASCEPGRAGPWKSSTTADVLSCLEVVFCAASGN